MSLNNVLDAEISKIPTLIDILWDTDKTPMLWGPPGVGKSMVVNDIAKSESYTIPKDDDLVRAYPEFEQICGATFVGKRVFDNRLLLMMPSDIKGVPVFDSTSGQARWLMTNNFPTDPNTLKEKRDKLIFEGHLLSESEKRALINFIKSALHDQHSVVFLDEISIAPKLVQGAALQLVLDRAVGEYKLPKDTKVVAAGNRIQDKVGASTMSAALVSRIIHIHIQEPSYKEWAEWAAKNDIEPEILGFLKFSPQSLFDFKPDMITSTGGSTSYACPRTWQFTSDIYKTIKEKYQNEDFDYNVFEILMAGTLGQGVASTFTAWIRMYSHLPSPLDLLNGDITDVDFEKAARQSSLMDNERSVALQVLSLKYAFITSLMAYVNKDFTVKNVTTVCKYINKNGIADAEWAAIVINKLLVADPKKIKVIAELSSDKNSEYSKLATNIHKAMGVGALRKV